MRQLRAAFEALVRMMLVLGLAFAPLAQPMAMAALAAPQQARMIMAGCPHHAKAMQTQAGSQQPKPGECCCKKGTPCHCAMTIALLGPAMPAPVSAASERPVSAPRLAASLLPTPEPPPPRT